MAAEGLIDILKHANKKVSAVDDVIVSLVSGGNMSLSRERNQ